MTDICNQIDLSISSTLETGGIKFYGFCQQIFKANQPFPTTIPDNKEAAINDRYNGITYYRLISTTPINQPIDFQWGNKLNDVFRAKLRNIVALKTKVYDEQWIYDYNNAIPNWLYMTGYKMVDIQNNGSINNDQLVVKNQEFGTNMDEKHFIPWNIYAIEYDVDFIKC